MMLSINSQKSDYFPLKFQLGNNNKLFSKSLTIKYSLPKRIALRFQLIDINGNILQELVSDKQDAGQYSADFNVADLTSGRYYLRIFAGKYCETKEMLLRN